MSKKISSLAEPRFQLYFLCLVLFAGVTALLGDYWVALAELALVGVLYAVYCRQVRRRQKEVTHYLEKLEGNVDQATRSGILDCPLPVVVFRPDTDEVIWTNKQFLKLSGDRDRVFDLKLSATVPGFDSRWLMEGKSASPNEVELGERRFQVFGQMARMTSENGYMATTYWVDVTELSNIRDVYQATRPVVAVLLLDNYEDAIKSLDESSGAWCSVRLQGSSASGAKMPRGCLAGWSGTATCSSLSSSIWTSSGRRSSPCWTRCAPSRPPTTSP